MMMNPFPFGFPPVRRPYPKYNSVPSNFPMQSMPVKHKAISQSSDFSNTQNSSDNNPNYYQKDNEDCFDFFGLKLHFDDLLIIALLYFLYEEEVKDTYLYIALILLLLS